MVPRVAAAELSVAAFTERIVRGDTFVVAGLFSEGFPKLKDVTCSTLAADPDFRDVEIRREYAGGVDEWTTVAQLAQTPLNGTFYWAVKEPYGMDAEARRQDPESSETWDERRLRRVQALLRRGPPAFLPAKSIERSPALSWF